MILIQSKTYKYFQPYFILAIIFLCSFSAYGDMLSYYFTGNDTLALIDSCKIDSIQNLYDILTKPLLYGTSFTEEFLYYRPISSLSYALDFFIWGTNPFGYHLTDLLIHFGVVTCTFVLLKIISKSTLVALGSSLLFNFHPVLMETVPAIARRQDTMAALFMLLTLISAHYYMLSSNRKKSLLLMSVLCAVFSFGAKETSFIIICLIPLYFLCFVKSASITQKIIRVAKDSAPYIASMLLFFLLRMFVLRGIGGSVGEFSGNENILSRYVLVLIFPDNFHLLILNYLPDIINSYFLSITLAFIVFVIFSIGSFYEPLSRFLFRSEEGRSFIFLFGWLLMPLLLFVGTKSFLPRYLYLSAIPFCGILTICWAKLLKLLCSSFNCSFLEVTSNAIDSKKLTILDGKMAAKTTACVWLCILSMVFVVLIYRSPIIQSNNAWKECSEVVKVFFDELMEEKGSFPIGATVRIDNAPINRFFYGYSLTKYFFPKTVICLSKESIQSWFNLKLPEKSIMVEVLSELQTKKMSEQISIKFQTLPNRVIWAVVQP